MDKFPAEDLKAQIYSAAAGRTSWEEALASLCFALNAWAIQLLAIDKKTGGILFSHMGGGGSVIDHLAYIRTYNRTDPRTPILLGSSTTGWLHCHHYLSDEVVAQNSFYQDFLIPAGGRYVSGTKLVDDDLLTVLIGVHRGHGSEPLGEIEISFLEKLRIHLVEAMAIYRHLAVKHNESSIGYAILNGLHHPTILIDGGRSIRFENESAKKLLKSKQCITNSQGFLSCVNVNDNNNLVAELMDLMRSNIEITNPIRRYLRLHNASGNNTVGVCLSVLRPKEVMGAFGGAQVVMVVIHDTVNTAKPDPFMLAEVFDLTPAEVQVATAISEGHSLEEIAKRRSVAIGTIREQLKSLFSKTQTNRQSDLVRRLIALSLVG